MKRLLFILIAILSLAISVPAQAGYEDFTTFTEVDEGGNITIDSATKVSWSGLLSRDKTGYVYKDYTANHFDGDFTHQFEIQFSNVGDAQVGIFWMLASSVGDLVDIMTANEDACAFYVYDNAESLNLRFYEAGSAADQDSWIAHGPQASTTYYVNVTRDDDGGADSTGQLVFYIRTGSHVGVLQDTLTVDASAGEQNDYQYGYVCATYDDSGNANTTDGFTQNLDLNETAATTFFPLIDGGPTGHRGLVH